MVHVICDPSGCLLKTKLHLPVHPLGNAKCVFYNMIVASFREPVRLSSLLSYM